MGNQNAECEILDMEANVQNMEATELDANGNFIKDGIFDKNDEVIQADVIHDGPSDTNDTISAKERKIELKTELATLLDGFSSKKPASINAVVLWNCVAKHPTDLDVQKGERVRILYRNGGLAFVENSQLKQGFVPLCYCSLYRRRSSSFSELFSETSKKTLSTQSIAPGRDKEGSVGNQDDSNSCKDMAGEIVKRKRFGKMTSKGTYDAKNVEYKNSKKSDKGIFNSAAKKLMKALTSNLPTRTKGKAYKAAPNKKPMPDWLQQLNFDYNNPDYSSSSDSSDEDDDSAYESFRTGSETRQSAVPYNGNEVNKIYDGHHFQTRDSIHRLTVTNRYSEEFDSQEFSIGYANVRKLRTSSKLNGSRVSRSRSFNLDSKTKTLHRVLQLKPKDLLNSSDSENEADEERVLAHAFMKRAPSHGCVQYGSSVDFQDEALMVALQDFNSSDSKDLSVLKGQKVRVLNKNDEVWWMCEAENGRGGFVPREFLVPEHRMAWTAYNCTDDGYFTKARNDCQDLSSRTKAASVKLARITPMAREPSLQQQNREQMLDTREMNLVPWNEIDNRKGEEWREDVADLKNGAYTGECDAEECYECIAACSKCHEDLTDGNSYTGCLAKMGTDVQCQVIKNYSIRDTCKTNESGHKILEPEEEELCKDLELGQTNPLLGQYRPNSCDTPSADRLDLRVPACSVLAKSDDVIPKSAHTDTKGRQEVCTLEDVPEVCTLEDVPEVCTLEDVPEVSRQLPTYDELMGRRSFDGLSEIKTRLSLQIKEIRTEMEKRASNNPGQIEKLLEEWRSQQKQGPEKTIERRASSDSQSTISDSFDSAAPRVLRRRNSVSKRVRFQTPESQKTSARMSESEKVEVNSGMSKEHTLATWL